MTNPGNHNPTHSDRTAGWRAGLLYGARLSVPVMLPIMLFGAAYGAVAAQKGLSLAEATAMSGFVFAGASQFVATEIWSEPLSVGTIAAMALVVLTVNMRFLLMGASLRPWLSDAPAWQTYSGLVLMTDPGWLIATRYRGEGGRDVRVFLGCGLTQWLIWVAATVPGYVLGAAIANPARYGLDLVMPTFFAAMLVPLWRGSRRAVPWLAAVLVSLASSELIAGWWFIVAGATAGALAAAFVGDDD